MEVIKSSRFWILLVISVGAIVLAALGKISGEYALTAIGGLLGGFGVGKVPGKPPTGPQDAGYTRPGPIIAVLALAALGWLSVVLPGCGTMSPESKAALVSISKVMVEAAAKAGDAGWEQAKAGCLKLETPGEQTACLMGVATAQALAAAGKAALVPGAAACPVTVEDKTP